MFKYGKTAQNAISAMSYLAEVFDNGETKLSSLDIAERRKLPKPLVAKVLVVLSQAGLVDGTRGPGGGYWLKKDPNQISLSDIVVQFEKSDDLLQCPFGPGWCGSGDPCPLHDQLVELDDQMTTFLQSTKLDVFVLSGESLD
ncbi:MAG TPA: Rrf2 family transcriptional regulator [Opitutae bacterium]|nr:Rrf2 family transcriptional regulator [Opitutae bacterium]